MKKSQFSPFYYSKPCAMMTDKEVEDCSALFSQNYGVYDSSEPRGKGGNRIKMPSSYYRKNMVEKDNMFVSICYDEGKNLLLGQCFYLKKTLANGEIAVWVTQLVVHSQYRNRGIGKRLLRSAWGFSNYCAWGLASTNAFTIQTLESVTWRKVLPTEIMSHINDISQLCDDIPFANSSNIELDDSKSRIFSNFFPHIENSDKEMHKVYVARLGSLDNGYEWLAFTFQNQAIAVNEARFEEMLDFSASQLNDSYSRMNMGEHPWAKNTKAEVDWILENTGTPAGSTVFDIGCGQGRHSIELALRGFAVIGTDFSSTLIEKAQRKWRETNGEAAVSPIFMCGDARHLPRIKQQDLILCLYDVIGSYRSAEENRRILRTIHRLLKKGGKAVISVMNMELTRSIATNVVDVRNNVKSLFSLPASNIMQKTGNIFNPQYFILDECAHLVYRKEQFDNDGALSAEYVIADYRYTKAEIEQECADVGLKVLSASYVQAGRWANSLTATDSKAKEILLVVQK